MLAPFIRREPQPSGRPPGPPQPLPAARAVDASHPTWKSHSATEAGGIHAEYWVFIDVARSDDLPRAARLVLAHLRDWRTFYRHSHVEFIGPPPDPAANTPVTFKFAPLALWGQQFTGHELTTLTVAFRGCSPLPDHQGWVFEGDLIDGYDEEGARLPHGFTGPVRTEVRMIDEAGDAIRPARLGIEVRDIWVDVRNNMGIPNALATLMHLARSAEGFGGLRTIVRQELALTSATPDAP